MFEKKENFFEKNKTFIAITMGAIIIGMFIYFSGDKQKTSTNVQTNSTKNQQTTNTSREILDEIFPPGNNESEIEKEGTIDYTEADNFVGEYKIVKGKVDNVYYSKKSDTTFINFCSSYKTCPFCAVVFSSDKSKFGKLSNYKGETVEITGLIKSYQGRPEIILKNSSQIKIVD